MRLKFAAESFYTQVSTMEVLRLHEEVFLMRAIRLKPVVKVSLYGLKRVFCHRLVVVYSRSLTVACPSWSLN